MKIDYLNWVMIFITNWFQIYFYFMIRRGNYAKLYENGKNNKLVH